MKDKQYLEIYPSEVAANKILSHMEKVLEDKPKVYKKTIVRYKRLAEVLIKCLDKINKFIESETLLSSDDSEFNEVSKSVEDNINLFSDFSYVPQNDINFDDIYINRSNINVYQLSSIIQTGSVLDFGYEEINQCAKLINLWFQARIPKSAKDSDFRYNINQIPLWISHIIITYGYYFECGKIYELEQEFKYWCQELKEDPHNTYRVPYCVYHTISSGDRENFTLAAVLIADMLLDKCYYSIYDNIKDVNYTVVSIVKTNNPGLSNAIRTRIAKQNELLDLLGFISTSGGQM